MSIKITWYSHACFLIETDKAALLVDPFLAGNPLAPVTAADVKADFPHCPHNQGIEGSGFQTGTGRCKQISSDFAQKGLRHLTAGGVVDTDKENRFFFGHVFYGISRNGR